MSEARPAFYALAPRRLARLCDAAARAVHALASVVRRDRGGARTASEVGRARLDRARVPARARGRRARARRAERPPARTRIPGPLLVALAVVSIGAACAIGIVVASRSTWWLLAFVAAGAFLVVAYNLELFGGRFHSDFWFAFAWGAFPVLTGYFASEERLRGEAFAAAAFAVCASLAQRTLSTQVRYARRQAGDAEAARPAEVALQLLAIALPLLAGALLLARSG